MDTRIYTITHKSFEFPPGADPQLYIPLHAGRALGGDLGFTSDDTGDNISEKNRSFCELTGIYWIWKNVTCDIAGTSHYRRYLIDGPRNELLKKEAVEKMLSEYDMLISVGCPVDEGSVLENYEKWHNIKDLETCRQVLRELYPEDIPAFDLVMAGRLFSGGNLFIAKKSIYDEYCSWLFSILFEVEKRSDVTGYDDYQKRLYGFLAERLLRVFAMARPYRIKEIRVGTTG